MHNALEFFAGIGLVRMALQREGWNVVFANDIDPKKYEMYRANFGGKEFHLDDITNIKASKLPPAGLATASFPCIDLSLAGNRAGLNGQHSSVFWHFYKLLVQLRNKAPRFLLIENVTGLLTSHGGRDLKAILESLNGNKYFCDLLVVDAANFVPQSRPRLFIVCDRGPGLDAPILLAPHPARPEAVLRFMASFPKLKWHHFDLPAFPIRRQNLTDILERFEEDDPVWWDRDRSSHLFSQISPLHAARLKEMCRSEELAFATVYKRVRPSGCRAELRFDGIAGCLRTPRGGSSKQFVIQAGHGSWRVRNMTAREYARLQGVPESFRITVPYNQALFGFGDAVCVPAVTWIIRHCFNGER
jgi:DNA (cytosine-5)-methyltransferase 1